MQTDKISQQPENCENRNDPDLVQAFRKKWWVESDFNDCSKQTNKNNNKNNNYKQKHLPNFRTADSRSLGVHKVYMQRFLSMLRLLRVLIKGTGSSFTGYDQENLTYFLHLWLRVRRQRD